MTELKYFNALMATVLGSDEQKNEAKKYLAEVDPEIWGEDSEQGPQESGVGRVVKNVIIITLRFVACRGKCRQVRV